MTVIQEKVNLNNQIVYKSYSNNNVLISDGVNTYIVAFDNVLKPYEETTIKIRSKKDVLARSLDFKQKYIYVNNQSESTTDNNVSDAPLETVILTVNILDKYANTFDIKPKEFFVNGVNYANKFNKGCARIELVKDTDIQWYANKFDNYINADFSPIKGEFIADDNIVININYKYDFI